MLTAVVSLGLTLVGAYLAVGVAAAVLIHLRGLATIDPAVETGSTIGFRLLITPGLVVLWPLLLQRWRLAAAGHRCFGHEDQPLSSSGVRCVHRRLATTLLVAVPLLAGAGLVVRPPSPPVTQEAGALLPDPPAVGEVVQSWPTGFADLAIASALRSNRDGALQLELELPRDLEVPGLMAFFSGADVPDPGIALGAVWGPGTRRFTLPATAADGGVIRLYSLGWRETVAEQTLPARETN